MKKKANVIELDTKTYNKLKSLADANYRTLDLQILYLIDQECGGRTLPEPAEDEPADAGNVHKLPTRIGRWNTTVGLCVVRLFELGNEAMTGPELAAEIKRRFIGADNNPDGAKCRAALSTLSSVYKLCSTVKRPGQPMRYQLTDAGKKNAEQLLRDIRDHEVLGGKGVRRVLDASNRAGG